MLTYVYKIIFADGKWYYGIRRVKDLNPHEDGYYGSPVTNKEHWKMPHSKIVLKVFSDPEVAAAYENSLIAPELNNPCCLNECANLIFSYTVNEKARKKAADLRRGSNLSEQHKMNISRSHKGKKKSPGQVERLRSATTGMTWWNNGQEEILVMFAPNGEWSKGRLTDCFGSSSRTKGWKWYHKNGQRKMFKEDPGEGWVKGRPRDEGKRYYNNGTEHVLAYECPGEGWVLGRLKKK